MLEFESIMDSPREGLDKTVWKDSGNGTFILTDEAKANIQALVDYVSERFSLKNPSVRITGSITSNQYSDDSDIDVHVSFNGLTDENSDDFNKVLRADFEENFKKTHADRTRIGNHPLEVYFQANPYQDLMSVGCYDFIQGMWLVGPDLKPADFDPYSEFYSEDMKYVKDVIGDIRNIILECYETAMVIQNSSDGRFKDEEFDSLKEKMRRGVEIFDSTRQCRKVYSSPKSVEDALRKRESRKWKIADSSFKLMDKFGYLKILKGFSRIAEHMESYGANDVADCVIGIVGGSMNVNETIEEGLGMLGKIAIIASLLAIPGLTDSDVLARELSKIPRENMMIGSRQVQDGIQKASSVKKTYGGYSATNLVNMLARTIYVEGHAEGSEGRKAICSVILNRSGGDADKMADVLKEKMAFSCWNKMTGADWKNFQYKIPTKGSLSILSNPKNMKIWKECLGLATRLFNGEFVSTIGNRNSYMNPKKADQSAKDQWEDKLDLQVGNQKFGYMREHDPKYVVPGSMVPKSKGKPSGGKYKIQKGDVLTQVAKKNGMTLDQLLAKNPQIKNPDKISIGQEINV